jgi:hypothetical protein
MVLEFFHGVIPLFRKARWPWPAKPGFLIVMAAISHWAKFEKW